MTKYDDVLKKISSGLQDRAESLLTDLVDLLEDDLSEEEILIWIQGEYYHLTGIE